MPRGFSSSSHFPPSRSAWPLVHSIILITSGKCSSSSAEIEGILQKVTCCEITRTTLLSNSGKPEISSETCLPYGLSEALNVERFPLIHIVEETGCNIITHDRYLLSADLFLATSVQNVFPRSVGY